ncbi:MAG TPA: NAD(P)H-dependent oxidoreductase [Salinimicrobium sp.]|nr:NAD(P)H-dependent oxidoreductase [Salinimicrobium sp.]
MKKILAFAGSNSPTSINHQLVLHVSEKIMEHEVNLIKLTDFNIPMYSIVLEKEGIPEDVKNLYKMILDHDALIISVNEYNHNVSGFFKNILDWLSREDRKFLQEKKILLMSTSPGKRGGASAFEYAEHIFTFFGGEIIESFKFPEFYQYFNSEENKFSDEIQELGLMDVLTNFAQQIKD